ncbi:uncharacterized protein LOC127279592 [Leptopilina boulardi]|uniref:uncharacterized protein LOC127279592 n=1 Tax=Leptopilina boulardi TaxID=63433 RepID=UPI0021F4FF2B|nr:uncharacterized protein LOC127279592 [Leptopilina boulardi]
MSSLLNAQNSLVALLVQFVETVNNTEPNTWSRGMLESCLELLRSYWNKLQENHLDLVGKERLAGTRYFTENICEHTEGAVLQAFSYLYDERSRLDSAEQAAARPAPTLHHLPRINLPSFNGAQKDWKSFRDLYQALIHTNKTLTDVQKLCHLKAALQGEAKGALDGVQVTDANYLTAWRLLLKRYDNKRILVQESLSTLVSISELRKECAADLQSLLDTLNRKRESLKALGRPVEHWDD